MKNAMKAVRGIDSENGCVPIICIACGVCDEYRWSGLDKYEVLALSDFCDLETISNTNHLDAVIDSQDPPHNPTNIKWYDWKGTVIHMPTKEFGISWAKDNIGTDWRYTKPFFVAHVTGLSPSTVEKPDDFLWTVQIEAWSTAAEVNLGGE